MEATIHSFLIFRKAQNKTMRLFIALIFFISANTEARIGESFDECVVRYGEGFWALPALPVLFPKKIDTEPFLKGMNNPKQNPLITAYFIKNEDSAQKRSSPSKQFPGFICVKVEFMFDKEIELELAEAIIEKNLPGLEMSEQNPLYTAWGLEGSNYATLFGGWSLTITHKNYFRKVEVFFNDRDRFLQAKKRL